MSRLKEVSAPLALMCPSKIPWTLHKLKEDKMENNPNPPYLTLATFAEQGEEKGGKRRGG